MDDCLFVDDMGRMRLKVIEETAFLLEGNMAGAIKSHFATGTQMDPTISALVTVGHPLSVQCDANCVSDRHVVYNRLPDLEYRIKDCNALLADAFTSAINYSALVPVPMLSWDDFTASNWQCHQTKMCSGESPKSLVDQK